MKSALVGVAAACALSGCMKNECGDGNDQDRGVVTVGLSRLALSNKAREDAADPSRQWWWCETTSRKTPIKGTVWTSISIDAPRNVLNGIGGWVRPDKEAAADAAPLADSLGIPAWRAAAIVWGTLIASVKYDKMECFNVEEMLLNLDEFVSCKEPVARGPATPGEGSDPAPLPPGSTGGDH